jgi:hypothetical protein
MGLMCFRLSLAAMLQRGGRPGVHAPLAVHDAGVESRCMHGTVDDTREHHGDDTASADGSNRAAEECI